jgi:ATP-dependent DNA helicase DinG
MSGDRITASKFLHTIPALVPAGHGAVVCGDVCRRAGPEEARKLFRSGEALVAHTAFVAGRLKVAPGKPLYDVLELFAFVRPGTPCVPSALGIARALGLGVPDTLEDTARS